SSMVAKPSVGAQMMSGAGLAHVTVCSQLRPSSGRAKISPAAAPFMTSSASTVSRRLRAIGPRTPSNPATGGSASPPGTRPFDGLKPDSPQADAGMRMEPPPSEPVASGTRPAASAAALPPEEPPGEYAVCHGLNVAPNSGFSVEPL